MFLYKYSTLQSKECDLFRYLSSHTGRTERAIFWLVGRTSMGLPSAWQGVKVNELCWLVYSLYMRYWEALGLGSGIDMEWRGRRTLELGCTQ